MISQPINSVSHILNQWICVHWMKSVSVWWFCPLNQMNLNDHLGPNVKHQDSLWGWHTQDKCVFTFYKVNNFVFLPSGLTPCWTYTRRVSDQQRSIFISWSVERVTMKCCCHDKRMIDLNKSQTLCTQKSLGTVIRDKINPLAEDSELALLLVFVFFSGVYSTTVFGVKE